MKTLTCAWDSISCESRGTNTRSINAYGVLCAVHGAALVDCYQKYKI